MMSDSDLVSDRSSDQGNDADKDIDDHDDEIIEDDDGSSSSESENDETEEEAKNIVWTGYGKRIPVLLFKADVLLSKNLQVKAAGERYHLAYKMVKTECRIIRSILAAHGFHEAHPNSSDFNMMWTGTHLKPYTLRSLQEFQKVNHFPRSYEITRKDRLYKNIQRMQQTKGYKHFDFVPQSFIVPGEFQDFCSAFLKDKGPWIVKPIASSRGRGIFLVNHPEQVPLDETLIVSRYIPNPLLIDGFKFDVRLYVAVTCYDPLIVYIYEEGLTRFATVQYDKASKHIRNQCMHLTNYSVNKKNSDYVKNDDPDVEDYGNKWSVGALLRYLRSIGRDTTALMMRVEDVIIKTLISAELPIATACKMFMPFRGNCFEVYGFDILVDENLRPWVLEVNLSPSLACDSPLDLKIKSNMISDLFSLSGMICQDPMMRKAPQSRLTGNTKRAQSAMGRPKSSYNQRSSRPKSASGGSVKGGGQSGASKGSMSGLTSEEIKMVRRTKEEYSRRGGWVRIFPSPDSWELYGAYLQFSSTHNWTMFQQMFPERAKNVSQKPTTATYSSSLNRAKTIHLHSSAYPQLHLSSEVDECMANALQRSKQYERKLSCLGSNSRRRKNPRKKLPASCPTPSAGPIRGTLVQGVPESSAGTQPNSTAKTQAKKPPPTNNSKPPLPQQTKSQPNSAVQQKPDVIQESASSVISDENPVIDKGPAPPPAKPTEPVPPPPQIPRYNVVELLTKGRSMSKVQARFAFATYLTRVQHRLMAETATREQEDLDSANEQMDLVLRFLKRAAGNLQQPFKVIVPSRKLQINDRRRILAKQLGDFVHIYNKETDQLRQRNRIEKEHIKRSGNMNRNDSLDEEKFTTFVLHANENELEEVLTTYTKLNKSASIFLGSNSKSTYENRPVTGGPSANGSSSDTGLSKRRDFIDRMEDQTRNNMIQSQAFAGSRENIDGRPTSTMRPPSSAVTMNTTHNHGRTRPMSASTAQSSYRGSHTRDPPDDSDTPAYSEQLDEKTLNSALQRIAARQQQRQYSASKGLLLNSENQNSDKPERRHRTQSWAGVPLHDSNNTEKPHSNHLDNYPTLIDSYDMKSNGTNENKAYSSSNKPVLGRSDSETNISENSSVVGKNNNNSRKGYSHNNHVTADDKYKIFIEDTAKFYDNESTAAYNQVTGVTPVNSSYAPSKGSTQYMLSQQQQFLRHQNLMEQSRVLLEQSKAKHQAMVAQAHAAKKGPDIPVIEYDMAVPAYIPKPPPKPSSAKKPTSAHRMARTSMVEEGAGSMYSSIRYDNGSNSKPLYTSGYNT